MKKSKLTNEQASHIRKLYYFAQELQLKPGHRLTQKNLAERYGVSQVTISNILNGKSHTPSLQGARRGVFVPSRF